MLSDVGFVANFDNNLNFYKTSYNSLLLCNFRYTFAARKCFVKQNKEVVLQTKTNNNIVKERKLKYFAA